MGTRSLTVVQDEKGKDIITLYAQYDGYPSGHGQELADFLKPIKIVNGLSGDSKKVANGMGCLAAQIVATFKEGPGGYYLHAPGTRDCGEEYIYTIYPLDNGKIGFKVQAGAMTFFGLPGSKQESMNTLYDGPVEDFDAEKAVKVQEEAPRPKNDFIEEQKAKTAKK